MLVQQIETSKVENLFLIENELTKTAASHGLKTKRTRPDLRNYLATLSPSHFAAVQTNLTSVWQALTACTIEEIDPWDDREFFKLSMRALHLCYPKDILDHFRSGDLVEGYDMNRLQIFRNMQFMEYSNYSLMEILSIEWPRLFERAASITTEMITYCDETLWTQNKTIAFNVPLHYMRELQTEQRQFYQIRFRHLAPLFLGPNKPFGILGTCECRLLDVQDQDKLAFI